MLDTKINWLNPYKEKGPYTLKGNLHTHTMPASPCGEVSKEEMIRQYENKHFDFLALTDHNTITLTEGLSTNLVMFFGVELDFFGTRHTAIIHTDPSLIFINKQKKQQKIIDENVTRGSLIILNHPEWQQNEHYSLKTLLKLRRYNGIEIYNSVINRLTGSSIATTKWDRLLYSGRRVLGFSNHDSHTIEDINESSIVVFSKGKTAEDIFHAIKSGCFYCSNGVTIEDIGRKNNTVYIRTANAHLIRFIGAGGQVLKKVFSPSAEIDFKETDEYRYIRIECLGVGEEISWSQAFFRDW